MPGPTGSESRESTHRSGEKQQSPRRAADFCPPSPQPIKMDKMFAGEEQPHGA